MERKDRKRKVILAILFIIIGGVASLAVIAFLTSLIMAIPILDALKRGTTYIIWGCLVAVAILAAVFDIRIRGSRRVLKVNVDLENSHFMDKREILSNKGFTLTHLSDLGKVRDGVPLIAEKKHSDIEIILREPIHTLVIGATGTGKTAAFVSPTIEILSRTQTKPSMVITDPKGELYVKHKKTLERAGYNVTLIDLADVYHSTRWNPFNDVWRKTDEMTREVEQRHGKYYLDDKEYLTNTEAETVRRERVIRLKDEIYIDLQDLIYTACPVENKQDMTWQRGARDLLFALALAFWEDVRDGYMPREKFNLYNLYRNVTDYAKGECEELIAYFNTREPTSRTRGLSNTVLVSQDRTLSSYLGDVNQYLNWMADGGIAALTSGNDIEFSEFDEQPNVLFLKIPDEKENRHKLVTLLITQMYKALVEKATRNQELGRMDSQKLLRNVYFIMDEFGNLPKLYKMDSIVTVGRSRGIFMMPVIQDFNQLDNKYGKEVAATIRSNCNIQIFIGSNDENTRRIFSEACGKKKVKQVSYSENKDMSVSTSAQSVPLIYPNELEHLNDPTNGIIGNSIVLCLGNYPIRGKVTPVFKSNELYKTENTQEKQGAFIEFDETKTHYDIGKFIPFYNESGFVVDEATSGGQARQVEQVRPAGQDGQGNGSVNGEQAYIEDAMKMSAIDRRIKTLMKKIPEADYLKLQHLDIRDRIDFLDELADRAAEEGNILLSADIENVRSFCMYSSFSDEEIQRINQ